VGGGARAVGLSALVLGATLAVGVAARLVAHPLHTSLAAVRYDARAAEVQVSLRVFTDDFARAAGAKSVEEAGTMAYIARQFVLATTDGSRLPITWCGVRREGDLSWICLRARTPTAVHGLRLSNRLLVEHFDDQVNIVQVELDGRRTSYLFTRRDGPRTIF